MILNNLKTLFNDPQVVKLETVQSLWSGYGEIARYFVPSKGQSYIGKVIRLDKVSAHPRGWNSDFSHQRKLSSYQNEQIFYQHYAALCDDKCRVPICYATGSQQSYLWLVLEDVDAANYALRYTSGNENIVKAGLKWLAYFHGKFLGINICNPNTWSIGTYWHLATRPDEWQKMPESPLKRAASKIDQRLEQATYKTQLHGDAKLANFCYSQVQYKNELPAIAALDFQYTGAGVGIKDVVYYLGCCLDSEQLEKYADESVDFYFEQLKTAINIYQVDINSLELEAQWRQLYCFAWADFERFLMGWAPSHHKLNDYSRQQTAKALAQI